MKNINVVIAGRDRDMLVYLAELTSELLQCHPTMQHIVNGHADPLYGHTETPDLLILDLAADWREQLGALCDRPPSARPQMLVIGPSTQVDAMRMAMRAGAKDYISSPVAPAELKQSLDLMALEERREHKAGCHWTCVLGARGGVGSTMIACNLAILMQEDNATALVDLDLQAGSLAGYLDLETRHNFYDAVETAAELDAMALEGMMTRTSHGLSLLAAPAATLLPEPVADENVINLFQLLTDSYEKVVLDLPRHLDPLTSLALERSDDIIIVMEQNVATLRDALRMQDVLTNEFDIEEDHIKVVVNRYTRNAPVTLSQIEKNLRKSSVWTVANDFKIVSESLNLGEPLVNHARSSAAAKNLRSIYAKVSGHRTERKSLVGSLTDMLRG